MLFVGNGFLQLVIAGRIAEILRILMEKYDVSNNTAPTEKLQKEELTAIQNLNIIFSSFHKVVRLNIPALVSMLSGEQETHWKLSRIQEISPI